MKIQIPDIGDKLVLSSAWTFNLFEEYRNSSFWKLITGKEYIWQSKKGSHVPFTFPAGTVLTVDRVYIRKGAKDFSSVTFRVDKCPEKKYNRKRFWAKLCDVNTIEVSNMEVNTVMPLEFCEVSSGERYACHYPKDTMEVKIYYRKNGVAVNVFKVYMKFEYKKNPIYKNKDILSSVQYTLKDMSNNVLFETASYNALKKKAKEIYTKEV